MKNEIIDLNILPIETLAEMANEKAELVEKNARKTVSDAIDCGRYLTAIKQQIEHGKWAAWLGVNWNYSQDTATRYMTLANSARVRNLIEAKSIREALRMIADDKFEKPTPRAARIPNRVEVVESASVPDGHSGDANKMVDTQPDPDPTPDPPTIRKTAKGSEKVSEEKKPRTQPIVPEVLAEEPEDAVDAHARTGRIIDAFVIQCEIEQFLELKAKAGLLGEGKKAAKALRKLADKLDPPTKFTRPDLEEVSAYFAELKASGPESFFDFYESKGWLVGKVSMKDWRASARKWVRENESNPFGGTDNGNGKRTAANADPESCLGPNGRPKIERAKIVYK
jgi:hypothetical protein